MLGKCVRSVLYLVVMCVLIVPGLYAAWQGIGALKAASPEGQQIRFYNAAASVTLTAWLPILYASGWRREPSSDLITLGQSQKPTGHRLLLSFRGTNKRA